MPGKVQLVSIWQHGSWASPISRRCVNRPGAYTTICWSVKKRVHIYWANKEQDGLKSKTRISVKTWKFGYFKKSLWIMDTVVWTCYHAWATAYLLWECQKVMSNKWQLRRQGLDGRTGEGRCTADKVTRVLMVQIQKAL
jgi:hypothetical protein